ncbi:putative leucine-rich repeat-containing protein DDB_G0290503 [Schistocerca serialis cubense]|uniref:putative leucine-rich repeat-containing protein DDB_G0290503 n=1 Tax=Schistocerca serialis cubense TaxID=2023355 RepID=UPI00214EEFAE|nr:putative leucine-rich repeat-containing protein DDB_G0290503 [Schistocerca serialis cubense]
MDLHQLEDRSDINSDSERLEASPRSRGKVKHMKAYFEPHDTRDDDLPHFSLSNYQTSVQSFTSDAEVKFSRFDIHTSVEEHKVCPECGDFQTECKCKQLKAPQKELPEPQRTTSSKSDTRPSECSFISNASLSTLLPHPSSSSNDLFGSDASLVLGSSQGDGKHLQETDAKAHALLGKQEEHGLEAGDYCRIVPEDKCKPIEEEGAQICVNRENFVLPDDSISSLLLFPPSDGVCSEDNTQQNQEDLSRTSTSDILSMLEKEEDHSTETANRDNNFNINQEGHKEREKVPEEEKMINQEINIQLKLKVKETETSSRTDNILTELSQKVNTEILIPCNDICKTVESVPTMQMDNLEESQQKAITLQVFEHTSAPEDLSYEKIKETQVQKSEEDVKSYDDQSSITDGAEYDNTKSDDTSVVNYQQPDQISDLSELQDEWVSDLHDTTHSATNKSLFGECSESLLHEDGSPKIIKSDIKNDDLHITECKENLSENSKQIVLPQSHYHEYQDLNISAKHLLQHRHNDWTLAHENMTDITENESLYENSDNVSLAESSPKLVVYGSSKDALKKVIHNQIFFPKNDRLGYLQSGKITDQDNVNSLTTFLSDKYSTQEQLANYFDELDSTRCKLMQDILKKDDKMDQLKKKIDVLESEIRYINRENTVLTNILANCNKRMSAEEIFLKEKCAELREKIQKIVTEITSLKNVTDKHRHEYECAVMAQKQAAERISFLKEKILTAEQECRKSQDLQFFNVILKHKDNIPKTDIFTSFSLFEYCFIPYGLKNASTLKHSVMDVYIFTTMDTSEISVGAVLQHANLVKEEYAEKEQQIILYEQRLNEAQNDLEELKTMVQEQASQAESYKNKYHQAEQELEELKHKLETTDAQNKLMISNAESEVQRVKDKIQEELQNLNSLTEEMEEAQTKLQEESQKRYLTEQQCEELLKQVQEINEKVSKFSEIVTNLCSNRYLL